MIQFRSIYNGQIPPYDLLRPYRPEDFEGLGEALHCSDELGPFERFWGRFSIERRDDFGDLR